MSSIPLTLALALAVPQEPAPEALPDREALAARVDAAHHPHGPVAAFTAFRSTLKLELLDRDEPGGEVELQVEFFAWQKTDGDRVRPLIRYQVNEAGSPIVRGQDRNGPWQLYQGEPQSLRKAQFADDLTACQRHTNLARQLLRCLDPGEVLRSLQQPGAVREQELRLQRRAVPCLSVAGDLAAFPLLQQAGEDAPVRLEVFVDKATGRVVAIEASPLRDGQPDAARREQVQLHDLREQDGCLVPRSLVHLFYQPNGQLAPQTRATLTSLSLRPDLGVDDFDRAR